MKTKARPYSIFILFVVVVCFWFREFDLKSAVLFVNKEKTSVSKARYFYDDKMEEDTVFQISANGRKAVCVCFHPNSCSMPYYYLGLDEDGRQSLYSEIQGTRRELTQFKLLMLYAFGPNHLVAKKNAVFRN